MRQIYTGVRVPGKPRSVNIRCMPKSTDYSTDSKICKLYSKRKDTDRDRYLFFLFSKQDSLLLGTGR